MQQVVLCFDWCALGWISYLSACNLSVVGLNWKAQCGKSRMLRLDGGKGRETLPIRTPDENVQHSELLNVLGNILTSLDGK